MPRPSTRPSSPRRADARGVLRVPVKIGRTPLPDLVVETRGGWTLESSRFVARDYGWKFASSEVSEHAAERAAWHAMACHVDDAAGHNPNGSGLIHDDILARLEGDT